MKKALTLTKNTIEITKHVPKAAFSLFGLCVIFSIIISNLFALTIGAQLGYKHVVNDEVDYQWSTAFFALKGKSGARFFFRTNQVYSESADMLRYHEAVTAGYPVMEYYTNSRVAGLEYLMRITGEDTRGWYLSIGAGADWRTVMARFNIDGYSKYIEKESTTKMMGMVGIMRSNKTYNWGIAYDTAPQGITAYVGFAVEW